MIEVERLTKSFGTQVALDEVTFRVPPASVVGLLGKNGAGKTTTLRILAGVLRPTSGAVRIAGWDASEHPREARSRIGYLAEAAPLYPELRVKEHLHFRAAQKAIPRNRAAAAVDRSLSLVGATRLRDERCDHLSRGMRQRVGLADALLAEPPILLLDEPTAGLDPLQASDTRKLIRELGTKTTVILSTHILSEIDAVCSSALVVDKGRLIAQGTVSELRALGRATDVSLTLRASVPAVDAALSGCPGTRVSIEEVEPGVVRVVLAVTPGLSLDELAEAAANAASRHGIPIREVNRTTPNLERIFSQLTGEDRSTC